MDVWVLMSGGIDSTACAHYFVERGDNVTGIFVDYGQLAAYPERQAAQRVAEFLQLPLPILAFECGQRFDIGEITGRNAFLIFAALMGIHPQTGALSLGVHAGTSYYDCGQEFISQIGEVVNRYSEGKLALHCPFLQQDKAFVYDYARTKGIPLSLTYSCEFGTVPPCGKCMSCRDLNVLQAR